MTATATKPEQMKEKVIAQRQACFEMLQSVGCTEHEAHAYKNRLMHRLLMTGWGIGKEISHERIKGHLDSIKQIENDPQTHQMIRMQDREPPPVVSEVVSETDLTIGRDPDPVMTRMKPLLVRLAKFELRGERRTQVKHTIIAAYLQARIDEDGLRLEKAIIEACDYFAPISERTVATAWKQSRTYLNKKAAQRRKELEENPDAGARAIADLVKRERRAKRTAKK